MGYNSFMRVEYVFLSVLLVSLVSLAGVFTLSVELKRLKKFIFILVSLAVGALFGDAFIHLLPDAFAEAENRANVSMAALLGIAVFFVMEKFFHWTHEHEAEHEGHIHPAGYLNIISDGMHNFIDGALIALSFVASPIIGFTTTVAVLLHEIPQEISDFGILVYAGFSRKSALLLNLFSACFAFAGAAVVIIAQSRGIAVDNVIELALPFTAGGFIYIAGSDLVPHLQKENSTGKALVQFLAIALGVFLMFALTWLE